MSANETPRTDAERERYRQPEYNGSAMGMLDVVPTDFARTLERELAAWDKMHHEVRDGLLASLAEAQRELSTAKQDAERYRWLRSKDCHPRLLFEPSAVHEHPHLGDDFGDLSMMYAEEELDAAIDAARKSVRG